MMVSTILYRLRRLFLFCCFLCFAQVAVAEASVVVIGNSSSSMSSLNKKQVKDIFLGKVKTLPDGTKVEVVDLKVGHSTRNKFYRLVVKKNSNQLKAYWAKLVFSGKGAPPNALNSDSAVKSWVAAAPGRIGYINPESLDSSVKVLLTAP